jgi:5-methylthioadenosine/S-adenosylhomocysteine deaminase
MKLSKTVFRQGLIVTMNSRRQVLKGDVVIEGDEIIFVGSRAPVSATRGAKIVEASDKFIIPGLIQAHIHLCQTLFRGDADDLTLLDWLQEKIWPLEHAHTKASLIASAELGLLELQKSGTTSILDMGTVRHTDALLETALRSGMRYWGGKCLMDLESSSGPLYEETSQALTETEALIKKWHSRSPLLNYALCPRFAISCTEKLLLAVAELQKKYGLLIHTHASENKDEIAIIKKRTGLDNVDYFAQLGYLNSKTVLAHGVHLTKREVKKMAKAQTSLAHCPSSNLKLGSGFAPITEFHKCGLNIAIGADGAPCNNSLDPFIEMRMAALLQKPIFGPEAWPAQKSFEMATIAGAKALSAENKIGSLEVGKQADVVLVDRSHPSVSTVVNPYSALVYSCLGRDVTDVFIAGRAIVRNREHQVFKEPRVLALARKEHEKLLKRI